MMLKIVEINKEKDEITIQNGPNGRDGVVIISLKESLFFEEMEIRSGDILTYYLNGLGSCGSDRKEMVIGVSANYGFENIKSPINTFWSILTKEEYPDDILVGSTNVSNLKNWKDLRIEKAQNSLNAETVMRRIDEFFNAGT